MNKVNFFIYIFLILLIVFATKQCDDNKRFKANLEGLKKQKKILEQEYSKLEILHDSVLKIKQEKVIEYVTIYKTLQNKKDETDNISNVVYTYDERQLDSTILSYQHIERK